jgi:radical SAM superfamily enzyme YgiQ (UPF0313 family)
MKPNLSNNKVLKSGIRKKIIKKSNEKNSLKIIKSTRVNPLTPKPWTHDWDNPIKIKLKKKKKHEYQFLINQMLKDKIEKKINF